jgi:hypothetical protein
VNTRLYALVTFLGISIGLFGQVPDRPLVVNVAPAGGYFDQPVEVHIQCPDSKVYYTVDGSTPGKESIPYEGGIPIDETTVIRAVAYSKDGREATVGHTYLISEPGSSFPVISLSISPEVLFDPDHGLYVKGPAVKDTLGKMTGANFWSRAEVPMHCEIFEADGSCVFRSGAGLRLFGGMSRMFPQKSMTIVARDKYGKKKINHRILGPNGPKNFKFLVLRNSGSDFGKSHFRDAMMTSLVDDWDIEKQGYRPAHLYLNGKYWGIYNMREKVNRYFLETHTDIDKDSFDLIEHHMTLKKGSIRHYQNMLSFLEENSLAIQANFDSLNRMMDIDNFLNYQLAQIYFDNRDAGGNIKFWRPQRPEGRWRWILYDTDWGFGLHSQSAQTHNTLLFHTRPDGPSWPNPPWSTFILRKLLENSEFRLRFINRMADHLNTVFHPDRVLERIDEMVAHLEPEIDRHLNRWRLSREKWEAQIERMRLFALERPEYVRQHLKEFIDVGPEVRMSISSGKGGKVLINDYVSISEESIESVYFSMLPVTVEAVPRLGHRFVHWIVNGRKEKSSRLLLTLNGKPLKLEAYFEAFDHPLAGKVMINEVSPYHKQSGDWLEIYNNSSQVADLSGWQLVDLKRNSFRFPKVKIDPWSYLVICEDSLEFRKHYTINYDFLGGLSFGLNKRKERLCLYSDDGAAIDSVFYQLPAMDTAFSLALLLPGLDNGDHENWELKFGDGTPNAANPHYFLSYVQPQQQQWMRLGAGLGVFLLGMFFIGIYRRRNYKNIS